MSTSARPALSTSAAPSLGAGCACRVQAPRISLLAAVLLLPLAGCLVGPDYDPPAVSVPDQYGETGQPGGTDQPGGTGSVPAEVDLTRWWESLGDPQLTSLINEAARSNLNLQLATARVREARAQLVASRSNLYPFTNTISGYSRTSSSENARSSSGGGDGGSDSSSSTGSHDLFEAGFDAQWEIDLFGGIRREVEAARGLYEAQVETRRDTLVTLLAEVANSYVQLRGAQRELQITEDNIKAQAETVELQRIRLAAGITSDLTVAQSEAQLQTTRSRVPGLEAAIRRAIHRLSVLLGRDPTALAAELTTPGQGIPKGPPVVAAGVPAELVRRRPDVRAAERRLAAATANIGAAVSDFYPKVQLTGSLGVSSRNAGNLFSGDSQYWSVGPNVRWAILSWYAILANIEIQNARQEEALITFKQTVLSSLEEVENALVAYSREQERLRLLEETAASQRRALKLATELNTAGVVDFLNVLNAQLAVFLVEDAIVQSQQTVSQNLIALYKALGGGWSDEGHAGPAGPSPNPSLGPSPAAPAAAASTATP